MSRHIVPENFLSEKFRVQTTAQHQLCFCLTCAFNEKCVVAEIVAHSQPEAKELQRVQ